MLDFGGLSQEKETGASVSGERATDLILILLDLKNERRPEIERRRTHEKSMAEVEFTLKF